MTAKQIILAATIAVLAAPATASRPAQTGPATVYCIQYEPETGSRIARQECMTKKQWAEKGVNVDELIKK